MNPNTFPTKGNLILAKNSLALATQGYGLMDKKRNILLRELMGLIDQAKAIQSEIDSTFTAAYRALQKANIEMGIHYVEEIADSLPVTDDIRINASSPCKSTIRFADSHIRNRFGCGTALQRMLLISFQCIFQLISFLQCITYCIKTAIAGSFCNNGFSTECRLSLIHI